MGHSCTQMHTCSIRGSNGYADVDDRLVWDVVEAKLPTLRRNVEALLREAGIALI